MRVGVRPIVRPYAPRAWPRTAEGILSEGAKRVVEISGSEGVQRAASALGSRPNRERIPMPKNTKKRYTKPRVTAQGSVDKITLQNKKYGATDGFLFEGNPISNAS
jgi:hypothetical protein